MFSFLPRGPLAVTGRDGPPPPPSPRDHRADGVGSGHPSKSILLVDDQPLDVELALLALAGRGLEECVVVAGDGQEAVDYLRRSGSACPRVVLLDLNMPGLGGDRVLEEIRGNPSWQGIRVVILTTSAEERDRRACARADRYLVKPLTPALFLGLVDDLIDDGLLPRPGGPCS